jgi:phosphohistidine phosphatase
MSRELLILRHAKSDWNSAVDDFERPLKKKGKKAAARMGEWLKDEWLVPDYIVSSPAVRALKTAKKVCASLEYDFNQVKHDQRVYEADVTALLHVLADCPEQSSRILLIGHNPGLEELLIYLVGRVPVAVDGKLLATATLARLKMPENWGHLELHCAELVTVIRAADLPV